jgi:D-alanyl-D-alanine carboxypeptidase
VLAGFNHGGSAPHAGTTPAQAQQTPGAAPSPGSAAPDPAQAALAGVDAFRAPFKVPPGAGIVFDVESGEVLWRRRPVKRVPIASLTKVMTALLVVENTRPGEMVRITKDALNYQGSGVGLLPKGRHVTAEALLHGLLLPSGNDAAIALAQRVSGTVSHFVDRMNVHARDMGLGCTRFSSPSGFEDAGNHSCAVDLAGLAHAVLDQPRLARIVRRRRAVLPFPIKGGRIFLFNNNPLLIQGYPGMLGIKTGFTDAAGRCLVAAAQRHGRRLGVVLLHSPDPGHQARLLLDRGFALGQTAR